jgi:hypothetical protein
VEDDLIREPLPIPDQVRGWLFRDHAFASSVEPASDFVANLNNSKLQQLILQEFFLRLPWFSLVKSRFRPDSCVLDATHAGGGNLNRYMKLSREFLKPDLDALKARPQALCAGT